MGLRPGDLTLSRDDEHVLALTAPLLAHALRAQALAAEVRESRGQTVAALEEERRRLRRDLHDGLGPRLSGIAFTSDAARNLLRSDPTEAERLLRDLRAETVTAIEEIRQLVYAMRPPALDELGLVPALRQQAAGLRSSDGSPLAVTLTAPADLPPLSAAVEVAAYRIVMEALANVARHTPATTAAVRIEAPPGGLSLVVTDARPDSRSHARVNGTTPWPAGRGTDLDAGAGRPGGRLPDRRPDAVGRSGRGATATRLSGPPSRPAHEEDRKRTRPSRVRPDQPGASGGSTHVDTWVWIVIAVVVVLAVVALLAAAANKKKVERRRAEAEQIRSDAHTHSAGVMDAERQAREAEQNAARARAEAERAEQQAAEAARARDMEHATHEDRIREADRIDPDVDTRSPDYVPGTQPGTTEPVAGSGGQRRSDPRDAGGAPCADRRREPRTATGPTRHPDRQPRRDARGCGACPPRRPGRRAVDERHRAEHRALRHAPAPGPLTAPGPGPKGHCLPVPHGTRWDPADATGPEAHGEQAHASGTTGGCR